MVYNKFITNPRKQKTAIYRLFLKNIQKNKKDDSKIDAFFGTFFFGTFFLCHNSIYGLEAREPDVAATAGLRDVYANLKRS